MKTLDIQYRQAQSVNIDLGMLDIANLLAFFMHQIFELTDALYQECRRAFGSRRNLWDHLRISIRLLIFPDWETLLKRNLRPSNFL